MTQIFAGSSINSDSSTGRRQNSLRRVQQNPPVSLRIRLRPYSQKEALKVNSRRNSPLLNLSCRCVVCLVSTRLYLQVSLPLSNSHTLSGLLEIGCSATVAGSTPPTQTISRFSSTTMMPCACFIRSSQHAARPTLLNSYGRSARNG